MEGMRREKGCIRNGVQGRDVEGTVGTWRVRGLCPMHPDVTSQRFETSCWQTHCSLPSPRCHVPWQRKSP